MTSTALRAAVRLFKHSNVGRKKLPLVERRLSTVVVVVVKKKEVRQSEEKWGWARQARRFHTKDWGRSAWGLRTPTSHQRKSVEHTLSPFPV